MSDLNFTVKFCKKCQAETERYASGHCKPCMKARSNARHAANPELHRVNVAAWRAANIEHIKAKDAARYAANPEKNIAAAAAWRAANPEKVKARAAAWQKANPEATRIISQNRRARKRVNGGILSKGLSAKLFKLQRGKCACCGLPLGANFHLDHILPIDLGGPNIDSNIQLLRQRCNGQKKAKHPVDFMQERGFLI